MKYFFKRNKKGFTLIEVVAALGLLALGLLSIMAAFSISLRTSTRSSHNTEAAMIVQRLAEEEKLKGYDTTEVTPAVDVPFATNFSYQYEITEVNREAGLNPQWIRKRVTVSWTRYVHGGQTKKGQLSVDVVISDIFKP